ncbi:MAG TPA: YciI family protein [Azospirillum sp.]
MIFMFHCKDKPGSADVRASSRAAHLEFLDARKDSVFAAGPLLNDDGTGMVGSLLLVDFADRAEAEAFAAADPYAKAGLFESVEIRPWRRVYPKD